MENNASVTVNFLMPQPQGNDDAERNPRPSLQCSEAEIQKESKHEETEKGKLWIIDTDLNLRNEKLI